MSYYTFLASFLAVYRCGTISSAAEELSLSQPAVTKHIQGLEHKLDVALFIRKGPKILPTDRAHALASSIAPHFDALNQITESKNASFGNVSIAGEYDLLAVMLMPTLREFIDNSINLNLQDLPIGSINEALHDKRIDFAIVTDYYDWFQSCAYDWLLDQELILVGSKKASKNINLKKVQAGDTSELQKMRWVTNTEFWPYTRKYFTEVFSQNYEITPSLIATDVRLMLQAVINCDCFAVLPRFHCTNDLIKGNLVELYKPEHAPISQVFLIWLDGKLSKTVFYKTHATLLKFARIIEHKN
jgi:DNA-binding transcriptional LysR family regulator